MGRRNTKYIMVLPHDLKETTGETSYMMAYGAEAVILLEVQMSSLRLEHFDENKNEEGLRLCNETFDDVRDIALKRIISQKQAISHRYNARVKNRHLQVGDLVLKKAELSA